MSLGGPRRSSDVFRRSYEVIGSQEVLNYFTIPLGVSWESLRKPLITSQDFLVPPGTSSDLLKSSWDVRKVS